MEKVIDASRIMGRRDAMRVLGGSLGVVAGAAVTAGCGSASSSVPASQVNGTTPSRVVTRTLSEADFALVSVLAELIIPKTDTAGAIEAGVPEFIDETLSRAATDPYAISGSADDSLRWDNQRLLFADGLRWIDQKAKALHGKRFLDLDSRQQFSLLEAEYAAVDAGNTVGRGAQFLKALKDLTVEGYYTSEKGLLNELGYKGHAAGHGAHPVHTGGCNT